MWFWFCIPLMYNDIKHLVIWLSAIHISSLEKSLSRFFIHFLKIDFFPSSFRFTNFPGGSDSKESAYSAGAAAASLQSCPTLCDPINGSPPGSSVPGILQARTLEWVAISFFKAWKWKVKGKSLSRVQLLATPCTAAYQALPSMGFSMREYWSGVPLSSRFNPWVRKISWRKTWQPTPVSCLENPMNGGVW